MNRLFDQQSFGSGGTNFWIGQVVDDSTWRDNTNPELHEDTEEIPGWGYRYKVRIFGNQTKNKTDEVTDEELPMADVLYPVTAGSGHAGSRQTPNIRQGNYVLGFYKDGLDSQQPVILGVIGNNDNTELEGNDPSEGFVPRTGTSGLSGDITVASKDQLLTSNGSGKPVREGSSVTVAAVSDPMQALGGNESTALPVADKNEESEVDSIQVIIKNLLAILNKVRSSQGSFFGAATAPVRILKGEINKATNMVASFLKSIIQKIRGAVITALNNAVKDTIYLLFPNQRPELNEAQNKATDTLGCLFNKIIDGLISLVSNLLKELIQNYVNAPLCAIENIVGKILNKVSNDISKSLDTVLSPIESVLSSLTSSIGGGLGSISSITNQIAAILQFLSCDENQDKPKIREWSPWGGIKIQDPLSGPLGDLIAKAGVSGSAPPCNTGPFLVKPPSLVAFGGNPTVQALLNPIVSSSGEIIGVDIVNSGSGYQSAPSIVVKPTNGGGLTGGGAVIQPIVTNGSVTGVIVKESGSGYSSSSDGTTSGAGDVIFSTPEQTIVFSPPPGPLIPKGTVLDEDYTTFEGTSIPSGTIIPSGTTLVTDLILPGGTGGTPLTVGATGGTPVTAGGIGGNPVNVNGVPVTVGATGGTPLTVGATGGTPVTAGATGGTLLTAGGTGGTPVTAGGAGGTPLTAGGTGGNPVNVNGVPVTVGATGGTPLTADGAPVTIGATGGTPLTVGATGGTPVTAGGIGGNVNGVPITVGGIGGNPVNVDGVPVTAGGAGGTPLTAGGTGGTPLTAGGTPVTVGATGGTPVTAGGVPVTIGGIGGTPLTTGGIGGDPVNVDGVPVTAGGTGGTILSSGGTPVTASRDEVFLVEGSTLTEDLVVPFGNSIPEGSTITSGTTTPYDIELSTILDLPNQILDEIEPESFSNSFESGDTDGFLSYGYNSYPPNTDLILNQGDQVFMPSGTSSDITDNLGNVIDTLVGQGPTVPITITTPGNFTTPEPQTNIIGQQLFVGEIGGTPVTVNGISITSDEIPVTVGGTGGTPVTAGGVGGTPVTSDGISLFVGAIGGTQIIIEGTSVTADGIPVTVGGTGGTPVTAGGVGGTPVTVGREVVSGTDPSDGLGRYPAVLSIKDAIILNNGINYQNTDEIVVSPDNGAKLEPVFDNFGKLIDVNIIDGGIGFTEIPTAFIRSNTGINAKIIPVFEVIKIGEDVEDAVTVPEGTPVVKVIDCVGQVT